MNAKYEKMSYGKLLHGDATESTTYNTSDASIDKLKSTLISDIMKLSNEDCAEILKEIKCEVSHGK